MRSVRPFMLMDYSYTVAGWTGADVQCDRVRDTRGEPSSQYHGHKPSMGPKFRMTVMA
jgi:hypothetical protein